MNYWLHPLAERELADAATHYARHANQRIAQAFADEFDRTANLLIENQLLGVMDDAGMRAHSRRRFPYSIVYAEANAGPEIYAVAHQRRKRRYWKARTQASHWPAPREQNQPGVTLCFFVLAKLKKSLILQ